MGCECCKKRKIQGKNISENIPEEESKEDDIEEKL